MIDLSLALSQSSVHVTNALYKAAQYWFDNYRMMHFLQGATERYGYRTRSKRTQAIKSRAQFIRNRRTGARIPAPKPPQDLVWTGDMRNTVASQTSVAGARVMAGGGNARIEVPINLGHPVRRFVADEVVKLLPEEINVLTNLFVLEVHKGLQSSLRP